MKIAVTGASGFVGSALVPHLENGGHHVVRLVRRRPKPGIAEAFWDPAKQEINKNVLNSCDAVIHLAGTSIAEGRWTEARKAEHRNSRIDGTQFLAETLAQMTDGPRIFLSASAIGYYGDRGDEVLDETAAPADDFLGQLCQDWEAATATAASSGIRCAQFRLGVVVGPGGGALRKMLLPFKLGLGGRLGSGQQWMSLIDCDDLAAMFAQALEDERWSGPVNAVAPRPLTNADFTKTLGRVLGRPTIFPVPAFMMRLLFGEMADALFFASARVEPKKALELGFEFSRPTAEDMLRNACGA